jgi:hypothetical protein
MKAPAFLQGFVGATRRAERVAKALSEPPEPAAIVSDPIDERIASLLESVSSKHEAQAAVMNPRVRPDRVTARKGVSATTLPEIPRPGRRALSTPTRTVPRRRPHRLTVRQALSGIAIELPRPYLPYTVRQAFSLIAIVLFSIAVGFLIVYLVPA